MKLTDILTPEANNSLKHIAKDVLIVVLAMVAGCEYSARGRVEKERDEMRQRYEAVTTNDDGR